MTKRDLYDAIGQLDAAYCRQALRAPEPKSEPGRLFRLTSAAMAAAVCAAAVGASVWFIGRMQADDLRAGYGDSPNEIAEVTAESTETTSPARTETEPEQTETEPPAEEEPLSFAALELHEDRVYTMGEVQALIDAGRTAYEQNPRGNVIDTAPYIATFMEPHGDPQATQEWLERLNSLENKSYLYHMMLNSVDYFDTAQGTMTDTVGLSDPAAIIYMEFQTDMHSQRAYESSWQFGMLISEQFVADGMEYDIDTQRQKYHETRWGDRLDFVISDNDRAPMLNDGLGFAANRPDLTCLGAAGSCALFPQGYAMSRLCDFDTWEITGTEDISYRQGTTCAVIEGTYNENPFKMYVDVSTGILMKYEVYDAYGAVKEYMEVNSLEIDTDFEVKQFDAEGYELEQYAFPTYDENTPEEHDDTCR